MSESPSARRDRLLGRLRRRGTPSISQRPEADHRLARLQRERDLGQRAVAAADRDHGVCRCAPPARCAPRRARWEWRRPRTGWPRCDRYPAGSRRSRRPPRSRRGRRPPSLRRARRRPAPRLPRRARGRPSRRRRARRRRRPARRPRRTAPLRASPAARRLAREPAGRARRPLGIGSTRARSSSARRGSTASEMCAVARKAPVAIRSAPATAEPDPDLVRARRRRRPPAGR